MHFNVNQALFIAHKLPIFTMIMISAYLNVLHIHHCTYCIQASPYHIPHCVLVCAVNPLAVLPLPLEFRNEKMLLYLRQSMEIVSGLAIALRGVPARSSNSVKRQLKRTKSDIFKVKRTVTR